MVRDCPACRSPIALPIQNQPPAQLSQQMPPIAIATPAIEYKT